MSRFIETICCQNGALQLLDYHAERMRKAREEVLEIRTGDDLLSGMMIPPAYQEGTWKCRILYDREIQRVEFLPHKRLSVQTLRLVEAGPLEYGHKYADRTALEALYAQRGDCDDILIVKDGFLTDSYVANVVLWDGERWLTPDTPLLPGCMRASLIDRGKIQPGSIRAGELKQYSGICLINALNPLDQGKIIPVSRVCF